MSTNLSTLTTTNVHVQRDKLEGSAESAVLNMSHLSLFGKRMSQRRIHLAQFQAEGEKKEGGGWVGLVSY